MKVKYLNIKKGGYTIIETMIATSLFLIVAILGMGALMNANLIHQKSRSLRSVIDSMNFAMEDISRNIKTGYNYHCFTAGESIPSQTSYVPSTPKSCASGWAIAFESDQGNEANLDDQWIYYISGGKIFKSTTGPYTASSFVELTPPEVMIDNVSNFAVLGAEPPEAGNAQQPFVTIRLVGSITYKGVVTPFALQTSASHRLVDI